MRKLVLLLLFPFLYAQISLGQIDLILHEELNLGIHRGQEHGYLLTARKGEFFEILVQQDGIDLEIEVNFSNKEEDLYFDSPNGDNGPEVIEFEAKKRGRVVVRVRPLSGPEYEDVKFGFYTIHFIDKKSPKEYAALKRKRKEEKKALEEWLKLNAVPLSTVEAGSGFEDLMPLKEVLKDKTLLGLGEATHGTREFFQMKHRLLEFLVTELDFTVFAIEASFARCQYINNYVLDGVGSLDTAVAIQVFGHGEPKKFEI